MSEEPEKLVLQLLRGIRDDVVRLDAKVDEVKAELRADLRSEINSPRADVASDMLVMRKETDDLISGLRKETTSRSRASAAPSSNTIPASSAKGY